MPIFPFFGQFDCPDEVPMNQDSLLFRSCPRHFLQREYINAFYQVAYYFSVQLSDFRILFDLCKKRIDIDTLFLCCYESITQNSNLFLKVFLLLLIVSGHFCKTVIADLAVNVILIKPLNDTIQLGDTLHCLFQLPATFMKLPIEFTLVFL